MIKKTLYFGNPAYLSMSLNQLVVSSPKDNESCTLKDADIKKPVRTIPIEDVGIVILDNKQITITQGLLDALEHNNCAVITCDYKHMPCGLLLPLDGNSIQNERFRFQIDASLPLRKQLWQQTVEQKIRNQAAVLFYSTGEVHKNMLIWSRDVKSGDSDNMEARAAAYYWKSLFPDVESFVRDRSDEAPNCFLNYGYSILRSVIARALVSSGLLPTLGIHHHNRYNAFCLADDIMEPYRPFVDRLVVDMCKGTNDGELSLERKKRLLEIPTLDVFISGQKSPLMVAASMTTASLVRCFSGEIRKIVYPEM